MLQVMNPSDIAAAIEHQIYQAIRYLASGADKTRTVRVFMTRSMQCLFYQGQGFASPLSKQSKHPHLLVEYYQTQYGKAELCIIPGEHLVAVTRILPATAASH
jgi:hypothetical protein